MRWRVWASLAAATLTASCGMGKAQEDAFLAELVRVAGNQVMTSLNNSMVDPWTVVWGAVWANGGRICGAFNPRDSAGAYVGFKRFVGQGGGRVLIDGVSADDDFNREWDTYCTHAHLLVRQGDPPAPPLHAMTRQERKDEVAAFRIRPIRLPKGGGDEA